MGTVAAAYTWNTNDVITAARLNANNQAYVAGFQNIDNTNIGAAGIFASQIIPTNTAQAIFGGSTGYAFNAPNSGVTPLSVNGTSGQTADLFDVSLTSGGTKAFFVDSQGEGHFFQTLYLGKANTSGSGTLAMGNNVGGTGLSLFFTSPSITVGGVVSTVLGIAAGGVLDCFSMDVGGNIGTSGYLNIEGSSIATTVGTGFGIGLQGNNINALSFSNGLGGTYQITTIGSGSAAYGGITASCAAISHFGTGNGIGVDGSGNLGASGGVSVSGSSGAATGNFAIGSDGTNGLLLVPGSGALNVRNGNNSAYQPVNGGTYTNASDATLKTNIVPIATLLAPTVNDAQAQIGQVNQISQVASSDVAAGSIPGPLYSVLQLNPASYEWVDRPGVTEFGFIAQEVEAIFPSLVRTDVNGIKGLVYTGITAALVAALQELTAEFNAYVEAHP